MIIEFTAWGVINFIVLTLRPYPGRRVMRTVIVGWDAGQAELIRLVAVVRRHAKAGEKVQTSGEFVRPN